MKEPLERSLFQFSVHGFVGHGLMSEYTVQSVKSKIANLPEVMREVVRLGGKRTKY